MLGGMVSSIFTNKTKPQIACLLQQLDSQFHHLPQIHQFQTHLRKRKRKRSTVQYTVAMSSLPTELITDILSRQPIKSLLRFRCVSKPWCSLIDGPDFIKLHLQRSTHTYSNSSLILLRKDKLYLLNLDSQNVVQLYHPLGSPLHHTYTCLVGSCNGLVCLSNTETLVDLWNPSTRKHHILPVSPIRVSTFGVIVYGFGYDSTNDDYKVLRIVQSFGKSDVSFKTEVVVYSLKLNSWRKIDDFPYELCYRTERGVFVSGALHYVAISKSNPDINLIVAFDLDVEKYRLLPRPEGLEDNTLVYMGVLGGCLCVISIFPEVDITIWMMKEYGVKESWTKLICIATGVISPCFAHLRPLAYSKNGDAILFERETPDWIKLSWYDIEKKIFKNAQFRGISKLFEALFFVGSLVSLKGDNGKKQLEAEEGKKEKNRKKG